MYLLCFLQVGGGVIATPAKAVCLFPEPARGLDGHPPRDDVGPQGARDDGAVLRQPALLLGHRSPTAYTRASAASVPHTHILAPRPPRVYQVRNSRFFKIRFCTIGFGQTTNFNNLNTCHTTYNNKKARMNFRCLKNFK